MKYTQQDRFYHRQLIYQDFIRILDELEVNKDLSRSTINRHKKFIDSFNLTGKAQLKTHELLKSYFKTKHKLQKLIDIRNFVNKKYLLI